jgi:hypothetical protein
VVAPVERVLTKTIAMYHTRSFFHHYQKYGIEQHDLDSTILSLEQTVQYYSDL